MIKPFEFYLFYKISTNLFAKYLNVKTYLKYLSKINVKKYDLEEELNNTINPDSNTKNNIKYNDFVISNNNLISNKDELEIKDDLSTKSNISKKSKATSIYSSKSNKNNKSSVNSNCKNSSSNSNSKIKKFIDLKNSNVNKIQDYIDEYDNLKEKNVSNLNNSKIYKLVSLERKNSYEKDNNLNQEFKIEINQNNFSQKHNYTFIDNINLKNYKKLFYEDEYDLEDDNICNICTVSKSNLLLKCYVRFKYFSIRFVKNALVNGIIRKVNVQCVNLK